MSNQEKALKLIQEIHNIMKENNANIEKAVEIYLDNEDKKKSSIPLNKFIKRLDKISED